MSGIVGILRTDGAPLDPGLIERLTESLAFRGPDAQKTWVKGPVAFGHTLLRTTDEAENEDQPCTLDGDVWIVAEARIDGRAELLRELDGSAALLHVPDAELILRAYLRWGESCIEHLLGDFAFGIWDGRSRHLFCARDHMGVKPFYYAHLGPWFIFSNTLDCIRLHPSVSDRLNDLAIADFLLFGGNQDASTTSFHDIERLSPAHSLTCSPASLVLRRYWRLPIEDPVYYRDGSEYLEQFNELLRHATSDRLRTSRVSVFMSGGLDSPLIAATAVNVLRSPTAVQAVTAVYDRLIPDSERHYAGLVAEHLGIPIRFFAMDAKMDWAAPGDRITPEPLDNLSDTKSLFRYYSAAASHSRVALYGEGPDNTLLYEWRPHLAWLVRQRRWGRLLFDIALHLREHRRVPLLPTVPRMFREWRERKQWEPGFPVWLNPELVKRLQLRERWLAVNSPNTSAHPLRPKGYASLEFPLWQAMFETLEPPYTHSTLEVRHPYVDLRVLQFMLRMPALPWCRRKHLLRRASHGIVPEPVWNRPKTPLQRNPDYDQAALRDLPDVLASHRLAIYADRSEARQQRPESIPSFQVNLRLICLSYWLDILDSNIIPDEVQGERNYESEDDSLVARST